MCATPKISPKDTSPSLPRERWDSLEGMSRDKTYIFCCYTQTCHLAAQACVKFVSRGYPVMELEGGFAAWKAAELDIEREPVNRLKRSNGRLLHRRHRSEERRVGK